MIKTNISGISVYDKDSIDFNPALKNALMEAITSQSGELVIPKGELLYNINMIHYEFIIEGILTDHLEELGIIIENEDNFKKYLKSEKSLSILYRLKINLEQSEKELQIDKEDIQKLDDIINAICKYTLDILDFDPNQEARKPIEIVILGGAIAEINGGEPNQYLHINDLD